MYICVKDALCLHLKLTDFQLYNRLILNDVSKVCST